MMAMNCPALPMILLASSFGAGDVSFVDALWGGAGLDPVDHAILFDVRKTPWYVPRRPLGSNTNPGELLKGSQGEDLYVAPNPPFGAVFTYYLGDKLQTRAKARRAGELDAEKQGEDTPYPSWDALRAEDREEAPSILLIVRDAGGNLVRQIAGETAAGLHRTAWDLRLPSPEPIDLAPAEEIGRKLQMSDDYGVECR